MSTNAEQEPARIGRAIPDVPLARHVNNTPFPAQYFQSVDAHAEVSHVVVLRLTYDMQRTASDGSLAYAAEQTPLATEDGWSGVVNASSPLWESDFAPFKPRCDVLITNAVSRPPADMLGARRWACGVGLQWTQDGQVHNWAKRIAVTGPRRFGLIGLSEPAAAAEVVVDWTRAYGGQDVRPAQDELRPDGSIRRAAGSQRWETDERNPVGLGVDKAVGRAGPQLELVGQPYSARLGQNNYPPVGLTALGRAWQPRRKLAGTYDQEWLRDQWPLPPFDFDEAYWNCAAADQQVDHLPAGTQVRLAHLHPLAGTDEPWPEQWIGQLPTHQVWLRLLLRIEGQKYLHDMPLMIDTLLIDLASRQISACVRYALEHSALHGQELLEMQTWIAPAGRPYEAIPDEEFGPLRESSR